MIFTINILDDILKIKIAICTDYVYILPEIFYYN
jgi:hypothetical protein